MCESVCARRGGAPRPRANVNECVGGPKNDIEALIARTPPKAVLVGPPESWLLSEFVFWNCGVAPRSVPPAPGGRRGRPPI